MSVGFTVGFKIYHGIQWAVLWPHCGIVEVYETASSYTVVTIPIKLLISLNHAYDEAIILASTFLVMPHKWVP
jgi:hypothetical protein